MNETLKSTGQSNAIRDSGTRTRAHAAYSEGTLGRARAQSAAGHRSETARTAGEARKRPNWRPRALHRLATLLRPGGATNARAAREGTGAHRPMTVAGHETRSAAARARALVALALLAGAGAVHAQVWVSNTGQSKISLPTSNKELAQPFRTGPRSGGYRVVSIELRISNFVDDPTLPDVTLRRGSPTGTVVGGTLTKPPAGANADEAASRRYSFATPVTLAPNTTYWVVATSRAQGLHVLVVGTRSGGLDESSWTGWSMPGVAQSRTAGSTDPFANLTGSFAGVRMLIRVNPPAGAGNATGSIALVRHGSRRGATPGDTLHVANRSVGDPNGLPPGRWLDGAGYEVRWYRVKGTTETLAPDDGAANIYALTEADVGFRIRAEVFWIDGAGAPEALRTGLSQTVALRRPGAPQWVDARGTGASGIALSWSPPADTGGRAVTSYEYRVRPTDGQSYNWALDPNTGWPSAAAELALWTGNAATWITVPAGDGPGVPTRVVITGLTAPEYFIQLRARTSGDDSVSVSESLWNGPGTGGIVHVRAQAGATPIEQIEELPVVTVTGTGRHTLTAADFGGGSFEGVDVLRTPRRDAGRIFYEGEPRFGPFRAGHDEIIAGELQFEPRENFYGDGAHMLVTTHRDSHLSEHWRVLRFDVVNPGAVENVCSRTPAVRDAIVRALTVSDCTDAPVHALRSVERLDYGTGASALQLVSVKAGDFSGLTALESLKLAGALSSLPDGLFEDLTALRELDLTGLSGSPFRPVVDAGEDRRVAGGATVQLRATVSGPWGDRVHLTWEQVDGDGSDTLVRGGLKLRGAAASFTAPAADAVVHFRLTAQPVSGNGFGATNGTDWVTIVVGQPPTNVCDRPKAVRDAIVAAVSGVSNCAELTAEHLAGITSLNLLSKGLTEIRAGYFAGLTGLTGLVLQNNGLASLPAGVFDGLTALTALNLTGNDLTSLPAGVFDHLTSLGVLRLESNDLSSLPAGIFDRLVSLQGLELRFNDLSSLPEGVFANNTSLARLDLRDNPGVPFKPSANAGPDQSVATGATVTLSGAATGPWGGNVTWAWTQVAGDGSTTAAPAADRVTLSSATTASPTFTAPSSAKVLWFRLAATPTRTQGAAAGEDWVAVRVGTAATDVCDRTPQVRDAIVNAVSGVSHCHLLTTAQLAEITGAFTSLAFEDIESLKAGDLAGLSGVTNLWLRENKFTSLPSGIFDDLTSLATLTLDYNNLGSLPAGVFDGLTSLATLTLDGNSLSSLPANAFEKLTSLTELDLHDNPGAPFTLVANAGADRTVATGATVQLSASAALEGTTTNPWGTNVTWSWAQVTGEGSDTAVSSPLTLTNGTTASPSFTAPDSNAALHFKVVATPKGSGSASSGFAASADWITVFVGASEQVAGVCSRTPQVRDAIVAAVTGVTVCTGLTAANMEAITGTLDVSSKGTTALKAGDFAGLTGVAILNLHDNDLTSLPADVIDGLTALENLTLSSNDLASLPAGIFDSLTGLTALNLEANELASLPEGVFKRLTSLSNLRLFGNPGAPFKPSVNAGPDQSVATGATVTLAGAATGPWGATNVAWAWTQVTGEGSNAEVADTHADRVTLSSATARNPTFTAPGTARVLWFRLDAAVSITNRTGIAPTADPDWVRVVVGESVAGVCDRPKAVRDALVAAVSGVSNCAGLTAEHLAGITSLNLLSKGLTEIRAGYFAGLTGLTGLVLQNNGLASLPAGVFDGLTALTTLNLTGNDLTSLPAGVFDHLTSLGVLRLESNDLSSLPAGIFDRLVSLQGLELRFNDLSSLPEGVFANNTSLARLDLRDNPGVPFKPSANAGPDQSAATGATVTLSGAATGPWGTNVTWAWTQVAGDGSTTAAPAADRVTLSSATAASPTFTAPSSATVLWFRLTATPTRVQGAAASDPDWVRVVVGEAVTGVCDRTPALLAALIAAAGVSDCFGLTSANLAAIGTLDLSNKSIASLKPGDFAGLSGLERLYLHGNDLDSLPAGIFGPLTALLTLTLMDNDLASLPDGVFEGLALTQLRLTGNPGANFRPTVYAGADRAVATGAAVALQGAATGPWGDGSVTWSWVQVDGASSNTPVTGIGRVVLTGADTASPTFTAPTTETRLHFRLVATPVPAPRAERVTGVAASTAGRVSILVGTAPTDVCERTPAVRDALTAAAGNASCLDVTPSGLEAITGILDLSNKGIAVLKAGDLADLSGLTRLDLSRNALTSLPAGVFDDVTALERLVLSNNALTSLRAGVFDALSKLTILAMRRNALASLPDNVFERLPASVISLQFEENPGAPFKPAANAGEDAAVAKGATVTLTGTATGPWGDGKVSWAWTQVDADGSDTAVSDPVTLSTVADKPNERTFTAPSENATLYFRLVATPVPAPNPARVRGVAASDPDWMTVTVGVGSDDQVAAPSISAVSLAAPPGGDNRWDAGDAVEVVLTFDEAVTVDTTGGTPGVTVKLGEDETEKTAAYASGSATAALTFRYTVATGEGPYSEALLEANSLALDGATIRSTATQADAELAHHATAQIHPRGTGPTATFSNVPQSHDGESAFEVGLAFSTESSITSYVTVRDSLLEVAGGTVTRARRKTQGSNVAWILTVRPSGAGAVTLTLPVRACDEANAVCIGGEPLVRAATATVDGPPFTASFDGAPSEHDGAAFTVNFRISAAPAGLSYVTVRDSLFAVTGGRIASARRLTQGVDKDWKLTAVPDGYGPVTLALEPTTVCDSPPGVCDAAGRKLVGPLALTVQGPPTLSVADAEAEEAEGATLKFTVTLSRTVDETVTVAYATADDTATAGVDYTAASGTLSFAAGDTTKTVSVGILDDAHDEGSETLTLTLSNPAPTRVKLAGAKAEGTITNTDPMPNAWMVRFGRTVAGHVVDALDARLDAHGGAHITVGGMRFDPGALNERTDDGAPAPGADARTMSAEELLRGSAFRLSAGDAATGAKLTAWGDFVTGGFEAQVEDVSLDGDVTSVLIGADADFGRVLAGVALSRSTGDGAYRAGEASGADAGEVESTLTGLYPYARFALNRRVSAWALGGIGSGELTLERERFDPMATDLSMRMGALGVKGSVLDGSGASGLSLTVKSDAMWVAMESERTDDLVNTEGDVTRLRLTLEGERAFALGEGATLTPSAEVSLRHDGGDAETGTGVELGGGLRYHAGRFGFEARARTLVSHATSGYEEWGVSAALRLSPRASGRGLSLSVAPVWGNASSASERLWGARDADALSLGGGEFEAQASLEAEVGYGLGLREGRGLLTPYAGLTLGEGAQRTVRTGAKWALSHDAALSLEGEHRLERHETSSSALSVRATLRF